MLYLMLQYEGGRTPSLDEKRRLVPGTTESATWTARTPPAMQSNFLWNVTGFYLVEDAIPVVYFRFKEPRELEPGTSFTINMQFPLPGGEV
jgi:hypothetical protein